ncbi:terpene synthase family protein [Pseudomonas sp. EL_65y_Pfl1_R83]|uniref:terpene synthase family protein n=1 Tax=Pseudomonas sp. EL_65y_Pfl1_R83 TaxID=3088697 RepID=UPI0030D91792
MDTLQKYFKPLDDDAGAELANSIRRAARLMPRLWKQRVGEQYLNYLLPCTTALMHRTHNTQPGIEGYENLWQNAGGLQVCVEFTYMVQNIHLPSSLYYSQPWQERRCLALNLFRAVNDLLSFRIMKNPDDDVYNLLNHLRHTQGYSAEQAAREVERWANQDHPQIISRGIAAPDVDTRLDQCRLRLRWLAPSTLM